MLNNEISSNYYKKLWLLFSSLVKNPSKSKWDFFDEKLTNLNLFYFHSEKFSLPKKLSNSQFNLLKTNLDSVPEFIQRYEPKLPLFNGKPWENLLIKHKIVENYSTKSVNNNFKIYFFKMGNTASILFEKFFSRHFWLTDSDRTKIIPQLIQNEYPEI